MRVLQVIHGYPPRYNAGSEVYTQTLANGLHKAGVEVSVFCREEDPFLPDYHLRRETDPLNDDIPVYLVNHARSNARFRNKHLEKAFQQVLDELKPEIIHFGHLSHLSTGLIEVAKARRVPVIFTLHDFWLMCPRGQFLQWGLSGNEPWQLCDGQNDTKCARKCFNRFVTGLEDDRGHEYWIEWVSERMAHVRRMCDKVDLFLAPSRQLRARHLNEFGLDASKVKYLDYGFDLSRLGDRKRKHENYFVFGYIGRHHPSKGIHHLLEAFSKTKGDAILRIWGRPEGLVTGSLQRYGNGDSDDTFTEDRVEWRPEYDNKQIVSEVFDNCDCIVVPSIWDENSPLVIHEAQQVGVPVITARHGGMGEYVKDGVNGLTFRHRDVLSLQRTLQQAIDDPERLANLGQHGYLYSDDRQVPSNNEHTKAILAYYQDLLGVNE